METEWNEEDSDRMDDIEGFPEDSYNDDVYDYPDACSKCGEDWSDHFFDGEETHCDPVLLLLRKQPKYDKYSLQDYTREKLLEIAKWQSDFIHILEGKSHR